MPKGIRKEVREIARVQPRNTVRALTDDQYEDLDDKFFYNRSLQPVDMIYEWKRWSVLGKEDRQYMARMRRKGWNVVPSSRHPETAGEGGGEDEPILIEGQILMEIPTVIYNRNRDKILSESMEVQSDHFKRLKLETPSQTLRLGRTYEAAQPIPE